MATTSRKIHTDNFTLGPGNSVSYVSLNPVDLSHARELLVEIKVTTANTDAGDSLDVRLQDCSDLLAAQNPTAVPGWNDRARSQPFTGDMSPTTTAPEYYRMSIQQLVDIAATEEAYEPSGSLGGSAIPVGSVINGPFPGTLRGRLGVKEATRIPNWRIRYEISGDIDADASFIGTTTVWSISEI
jgi:hypothetical protein